jgi:hypothetical protein
VTPVEHTAAIGQILDALAIPWVLGGSMASSIVGEPRSTMDIDVAIQVDVGRVPDLVAAVANDYYVSEAMALDAVERHSSFNLIHFNTGMKIDLFPLSDDLLDVPQLHRRERFEVAPGIKLWVGAADDQVLRKLRWYRMGERCQIVSGETCWPFSRCKGSGSTGNNCWPTHAPWGSTILWSERLVRTPLRPLRGRMPKTASHAIRVACLRVAIGDN